MCADCSKTPVEPSDYFIFIIHFTNDSCSFYLVLPDQLQQLVHTVQCIS